MDGEFTREVLHLAEGHSLQKYDQDLKRQALEFGVTPLGDGAIHGLTNSKPASTSSPYHGSTSNGSQTSQSTGLTADHLRTSKEHPPSNCANSCLDRRSSGTSVSIKDYDLIVSNAKNDHRRTSLNFSPMVASSPHTSPSPDTSSLDKPRKQTLLRNLGQLTLRKSSSNPSLKDVCPHCPRRGIRSRRPLYTLPCGHRYCKEGLQDIVKRTIDHKEDVPPTCCKHPIPGALVKSVTSEEEQNVLMRRMADWDDTASAVSRDSLSDVLTSLEMEEAQDNLRAAMDLASFAKVYGRQELQRDRFVIWDTKHKEDLCDENISLKQARGRAFDREMKEILSKHITTNAEVEDKHVSDEAEMLDTHRAERLSIATRLRHIETFCRGESVGGTSHGRNITKENLRQLSLMQHKRDTMDDKYASDINVLRGQQIHRMKVRIEGQEREVRQLETRQQRELEVIQHEYDEALRGWNQGTGRLKAKLHGWWYLEIEILRARVWKDYMGTIPGPFPPHIWPVTNEKDCVELEREELLNRVATVGDEEEEGDGNDVGSSELSTVKKRSGISSAFAVRGHMIGPV